ncbi:hypothetical protein [Acidilobus sp.]|uniref:hypothetical protein n=1 Tax=Acidilobus sp. TaxID=1872109 RepID=UPI003D0122BD
MSEDQEESKETEEVTTEESSEAESERTAEEAEALEYKVSSPELLQIMLDAFDILEEAEEGKITVDEAKALYLEKVEDALKKVGESVKKRRRRGSRSKSITKKSSTRKRRKSSKSKEESEPRKEPEASS